MFANFLSHWRMIKKKKCILNKSAYDKLSFWNGIYFKFFVTLHVKCVKTKASHSTNVNLLVLEMDKYKYFPCWNGSFAWMFCNCQLRCKLYFDSTCLLLNKLHLFFKKSKMREFTPLITFYRHIIHFENFVKKFKLHFANVIAMI